MKPCSQCKMEFPDHFQFCGSCGWRLGEPPPDFYSDVDFDNEETMSMARGPERDRVAREPRLPTPRETTFHPTSDVKSAPTLTILSSYSEPDAPSQLRWQPVLLVGFLLVLFVTIFGIGGWYLWRRPISETAQSSSSNLEAKSENPSPEPSYPATSASTPQVASITAANEEIKRLRERRILARPSDRLAIISVIQQAENNYPTDYRFPYELSKLSIKGITSHDEAFESLARAATKAIDNGQAEEMLNSFIADKDGDFHKLSHGHHEWQGIEQALRKKDKGLLKMGEH